MKDCELVKLNLCLGCVGLTEVDWQEPEKCPYADCTQDIINSIFRQLGVDKKCQKKKF